MVALRALEIGGQLAKINRASNFKTSPPQLAELCWLAASSPPRFCGASASGANLLALPAPTHLAPSNRFGRAPTLTPKAPTESLSLALIFIPRARYIILATLRPARSGRL